MSIRVRQSKWGTSAAPHRGDGQNVYFLVQLLGKETGHGRIVLLLEAARDEGGFMLGNVLGRDGRDFADDIGLVTVVIGGELLMEFLLAPADVPAADQHFRRIH